MAGTIEGGKQAAATNKARYGHDFYRRVGALGGKVATDKPKGFAHMKLHDPERVSVLGTAGGSISTRLGIKTGMGKRRQEHGGRA